MTTDPKTNLFVPPAAEGLPLAALDSATVGADRLDAAALTPTGRNFLAHALVQLARDGWLRTEPGDGFESVRDREAPEPPTLPSVVVSADRATLRDRIAAAMREHWLCTVRDEADADGNLPCRCGDWREPGAEVDDENDWDSHLADVALAVLPTPADRATLLREAADELAALDPAEAALAGQYAFADAAAHLRRKANEAEFAATPCSPMVPCEDGGEPCDVHERLLGHYDGSHELCAPDCADGPSRVAAEEQPTETQDDEVDADTAAKRAAQVISTMGADIRTLTQERNRYRNAWHNARARAADAEDNVRVVEAETHSCRNCEGIDPDTCLTNPDRTQPAVVEQPDTQTREARAGRCSAVMLRVHHAPHGWEPQPGMDPVHCPGYPQPAP